MPFVIPLTRGYVAEVDDEDGPWALLRSWRAKVGSHGDVYAVTGQSSNGTYETLHRAIATRAGLDIGGLKVDHRDGDSLNDRRANLRAATHGQNMRNVKLRIDNKSGLSGVCSYKGKWVAEIYTDGVRRRLGTFTDLDAAVRARLDAEALEWGVQPQRKHLHG